MSIATGVWRGNCGPAATLPEMQGSRRAEASPGWEDAERAERLAARIPADTGMPAADLLELCAQSADPDNALGGAVRALAARKDRYGRSLPVNVDGAIAAVCADLGFAYELGNAVFLISRLPGLIAHAHEERTRQAPMRQIDPKDHDYDGSRERRLPEGRK